MRCEPTYLKCDSRASCPPRCVCGLAWTPRRHLIDAMRAVSFSNAPGSQELDSFVYMMYEAGSAYMIQPYLRSIAHAVDRCLTLKIRYSDSDGPRGLCTWRFHASARLRSNSTELPHDCQNTRRSAVHREVRPKCLPARSPRRVRAQRREQIAFKMRFHIAKLSINRYWVNCDQVS
jgi:hypothetical protein